jgi:hypothetical protein
MSNLSYNEKYNIMTNRVIFADYIARKELNLQGNPLALNIGQPNNEASIYTSIRDGQVHTTAAEYASYLGQSTIITYPPTLPDPPTSLSVIPSDSALTIIFIAGFNGNTPITDYLFSTDGSIYTPLGQTGNPVNISGLTNGTVYTISLKAVNSIGQSIASSSVTAAPIPSSFNPATVSGINLWLDAQVAANVILSGTQVSAWNDRAGSNNFTKNATGIINYAQPGINDRPALNFITATPTTTYLYNTMNITPTNQLSLFMVLSQTGSGVGNSELFYTRTSYVNFDLFNNTNSTGILSLNARSATQRITGSNIVNSTNNIISVVLDTTGSVYLNGSPTSIASTSFAGTSLNASFEWAISAGAFKGFIGEVITYPSVLSDTNRQKIEGYLAWKWGLQASLPIGHPYKNAPPN